MRLGLTAALAPRRSYWAPTLPAHGADQRLRVPDAEESMTQETLRRQQQLLDRGNARHAARG